MKGLIGTDIGTSPLRCGENGFGEIISKNNEGPIQHSGNWDGKRSGKRNISKIEIIRIN